MKLAHIGPVYLRVYAWLTGLVLGAVDAVAAVYVLAHPQWLGHMVACLCLSGILAVLVTPRLAVVTGRRPINFAASLFMLAGACISMVDNHVARLIAFALMGLGYGMSWANFPFSVHELSLRGHRRLTPQVTAIIGIGAGLGIAVAWAGWLFNGSYSPTFALVVLAVLSAGLLLLVATLPESPVWYALKGRDEQAFAALKALHGPLEAAVELDWVRMDSQMLAEQQPLRWADLKLPQVRSSLVTAMILLLAQESPGAVALVVVTPLTLVSAGAAGWTVGLFALVLALISAVAWLIVTRSWGQRYLRVLFGCIVLVLASMTALASLPKLGLDAWGGLLLIILVSAFLAVQRWLIYPACHGAIDTRVPPWLVNWQREQSALANALARFVVLGVAALAVEFSFKSLLMALFVFYLWVCMLVMVRMPRELRM